MIKVKGISVRSDELNYDFTEKFYGLNSKGQRRLFLENKDRFLCDALNSDYSSIKKLAEKHLSDCSSKALNTLIEELITGMEYYDSNLVLKILNVPHLKLKSKLREKLSNTYYWPIKLWVAKDVNTPLSILNDMFYFTSKYDVLLNGQFNIFFAIINNPNFEMTKELEHRLYRGLYKDHYSKIMEKVKELTEKTE